MRVQVLGGKDLVKQALCDKITKEDRQGQRLNSDIDQDNFYVCSSLSFFIVHKMSTHCLMITLCLEWATPKDAGGTTKKKKSVCQDPVNFITQLSLLAAHIKNFSQL